MTALAHTDHVPLASQISEVERELAIRVPFIQRCWSSRSQAQRDAMERQLRAMRAVLRTLKWLERHEGVFRAAVGDDRRDGP